MTLRACKAQMRQPIRLERITAVVHMLAVVRRDPRARMVVQCVHEQPARSATVRALNAVSPLSRSKPSAASSTVSRPTFCSGILTLPYITTVI